MSNDASFRLPEPAVAKDPGVYYETLRGQCPVAHTDAYGGFWLMSRYRDVYDAILNTDIFSSASCITIPVLPKPPVPCLEQDDPEHRKYRRPMQAWFTVARMSALEPRVRQIVTDHLDPIVADGRCDLATALARPIPPIVIGLLFGLPEDDWRWFGERGNAFMHLAAAGDLEGSAAAIADVRNYLSEALEQRRLEPRDDILSNILAMTIDGEPISNDRALSLAEMVLGAGHETTVGAIGGLLYQVARCPEIRDRLIADPSLIEKAVEEAVRVEAPFPGLGRMITDDCAVGGVPMPAGDRVMLLFGSANRDPDQFESPEEFRIDRSRNPHLGFGAGVHRCVGAPLARLEMRIVLEEVLRRLPDLRIEDEEAVEVRYALGRSFVSLPVAWTVLPTAIHRHLGHELEVDQAL
jgi:cytochrome P450